MAEVIAFMDDHRGEHGVEPMCRVLNIAPSTWHAHAARKVWRQLLREGFDAGRDRVARLMRKLGLEGARRGRRVKTTVSDKTAPCPLDKVNRQFTADRPNRPLARLADARCLAGGSSAC